MNQKQQKKLSCNHCKCDDESMLELMMGYKEGKIVHTLFCNNCGKVSEINND